MLILTITGLLVEVCLVGMVFLHDLRQHTIPFLKLYGLACLGYGIAVYWLLRGRHRSEPRRQGDLIALILGLAVLFRATLLFTANFFGGRCSFDLGFCLFCSYRRLQGLSSYP